MVTPTFTDVTVTYDGQPKSIAVSGLPSGATVLYSVNGGAGMPSVSVTNAGTYTVVATITLPAGYAPVAPMTATLTVQKANVDMTGIALTSASLPYNGAPQTLSLTGTLPAFLDVEMTGYCTTGTAQVRAEFYFTDLLAEQNYNLPAAMTATLTIVPSQFDLSGYDFEDKTVDFNANDHYPFFTDPSGLTMTVSVKKDGVEVTEVKAPGVYNVTVSFTVAEPAKYQTPEDKTYTITVNKGILTVGAPTWQPKDGWDVDGIAGKYFTTLDGVTDDHGVVLVPPTNDMVSTSLYTFSVSYTHTCNGTATEDLTQPGLYVTTATLTFTSEQYDLPAGYEMTYTYTWRTVGTEPSSTLATFADKTVTYNGEAHTITATWDAGATYVTGVRYFLLADGEYTELGDGVTAAGVYTLVAVLDTDPETGYAPLTVEATLTVSLAVIDLSSVTPTWNYSGEPFVKDGEEHTVLLAEDTLAALDALGIRVEYEGNTATEKGEYTAKAILLAKDANYVSGTEFYTCSFGIVLPEGDQWTPETVK